jgi:hypothetical protein
LGILYPLKKQVDAVTNPDWATGQDDDESLIFGVVVPVELSLVDEHGDLKCVCIEKDVQK